MDPISLPSLDYLFRKGDKSHHRGDSYFTLGETIDMAIDLELHANFLLEEALQKTAQENPGKDSNGVTYPKDIPSMNDSGVNRRRQEDSRPPRHPFSDFPSAVSEVPLSRSNSGTNKRERDSEKEPYSFASAKDTFIDEGGVFKRKKEDYKPIRNPSSSSNAKPNEDSVLPPELAMHDKALVEKIESEIIHHGQPVRFDDISGLEFAKQCVEESVCW